MNRIPVVAGRFYPGTGEQCLSELKECLEKEKLEKNITSKVLGGIVPHAGWVYSGSTAGLVFQAIKQFYESPVFIFFGAVHVYGVTLPSIFSEGLWETPVGDIQIDEELSQKIMEKSDGLIIANESPHNREHSIEVQLPFVKYLFPDSKIVTIMVPPDKNALQTGEIVGRVISGIEKDCVVIGSTDLTHYGSNYDMFVKGSGMNALEWVKNVNDKKLIDLMLSMKSDKIVPQASGDRSACGAGAITATISAVKAMGANKGELLKYTTSYDEIPSGHPNSFVGYAGVIFS